MSTLGVFMNIKNWLKNRYIRYNHIKQYNLNRIVLLSPRVRINHRLNRFDASIVFSFLRSSIFRIFSKNYSNRNFIDITVNRYHSPYFINYFKLAKLLTYEICQSNSPPIEFNITAELSTERVFNSSRIVLNKDFDILKYFSERLNDGMIIIRIGFNPIDIRWATNNMFANDEIQLNIESDSIELRFDSKHKTDMFVQIFFESTSDAIAFRLAFDGFDRFQTGYYRG